MMYNYEREWREYAAWRRAVSLLEYYQHQNICYSCGGFGDHGLDEDGKLYVCYSCGGTGKYFVEAE